jgi:hypothetical protein
MPPSAVENQPPPYQQQPYQQQPYQHQQPPFQHPTPQPPPYQQQNYQQPTYQQTPLVPQSYGFAPAPMPAYIERKDRTVSLLLAILIPFGFWTWLYTYKKDAWKFWLSLGLQITIFNPLWTWILLFLPNIGFYIWAIVDVAAKPQQFYDYYPNA